MSEPTWALGPWLGRLYEFLIDEVVHAWDDEPVGETDAGQGVIAEQSEPRTELHETSPKIHDAESQE